MLAIAFDPQKLPRSMKRTEWREIDRWRRTTQRQIDEHAAQMAFNLGAFGTTRPELASTIAERLINPPVLIGPYQDD